MSKKKRILLLSLLFPLLTGCASFVGLASERYDGVKLERDEETITAYKENREILGEEKESYFSEPLLKFLSQPALPYPEEEVMAGLNSWPHIVGDSHVPEGRYQILFEGYFTPDSFIVTDVDGEMLYQQALGYSSNSFELNLFEGQEIKGTSTDAIASLLLINEPRFSPLMQPPTFEEEGIQLANGVWHVGEHIPAGNYRVQIPSGYAQYIPHLYLVNEDGSTRLFELLGSLHENEEVTIDLALEEGQLFMIENSQVLNFVPVGE